MSATALLAAEIQRAAMRSDGAGAGADTVLRVGAIDLDRLAHRVRRNGHPVHLGPTEFRLLEFLMRRPGQVFSRSELQMAIWGGEHAVDDRTVDVHVGRLRRAIGRNAIRTVRGFGYAVDETADARASAEGNHSGPRQDRT